MNILVCKFLVILSSMLLLQACESPTQKKNEQATNPEISIITHKDYSRLLAKVQAKGHLRIIVQLNMPFVPDGQLSAQAAMDQQMRISRMQDQLCAALAQYKVKSIKRFKYTPYIAMEVDSAALKALISDSLVLSLEEDAPVPPTVH